MPTNIQNKIINDYHELIIQMIIVFLSYYVTNIFTIFYVRAIIISNGGENLKIIMGLIINKPLYLQEEIQSCFNDITTYISLVDNVYIYNVTKSDLTPLYEKLQKYSNIEYTTCEDLGEAANYQRVLEQGKETESDYVVILEPGYYYEEGAFLAMKRFAIENNMDNVAIVTPIPLYGCQIHERKPEPYRTIAGGCRFTGALINIHIYKETTGIRTEYYQTTFDYEYCIRVRLQKKQIILLNNEVLRNTNYRIIEKRFLFSTLSTFDKDVLEIYYEYRNRLFLWKEYQKIDPYYVKIDKKIARAERHEMKFRDKAYRDKLTMFEQAKEDFKKGKLGKYNC